MLYLYDNAIVDDLRESFKIDDPESGKPVVGVVSPDAMIGIAAQIQDDLIGLPFVTLERNDPISIDSARTNFVKSKIGVDCVFDPETNNYYKERSLPISLSYTLSAFTSNQADLDEIMREIMFKYDAQYFLSIEVPYEGRRPLAFGVSIDWGQGISQKSGVSEYSASGTLYQASMQLDCEGCVLLNYVPVHIQRNVYQVDAR